MFIILPLIWMFGVAHMQAPFLLCTSMLFVRGQCDKLDVFAAWRLCYMAIRQMAHNIIM